MYSSFKKISNAYNSLECFIVSRRIGVKVFVNLPIWARSINIPATYLYLLGTSTLRLCIRISVYKKNDSSNIINRPKILYNRDTPLSFEYVLYYKPLGSINLIKQD